MEVIDFMPVAEDGTTQPAFANQIIRQVKAVKGPVRLKIRCAPRFDYARATHSARKLGNAVCFSPEGKDLESMTLYPTVPLVTEACDAVADFVLQKGETAAFAFGSVREEELGSADFLETEAVEHCSIVPPGFGATGSDNRTTRGGGAK